MDTFKGLEDKLNIDPLINPNDNLAEIKKDVEKLDIKKKELLKNKNELMLHDQSFLEDEIKSLVLGARSVMQRLEEDLKIGSADRKFEVYAKLLESVGKQYQTLLELNRIILEAKIQTNRLELNDIKKDDKVALTVEQLSTIIENARNKSQLNKIDANFTIDEKTDKEFDDR